MNEFPTTEFKRWTDEEKNVLRWLIRLGCPIQFKHTQTNAIPWTDDTVPDPDDYPHLTYRIKPKA